MSRSKIFVGAAITAALILAYTRAAGAATTLGIEGGMGFATMNGDAPLFVNPIACPAGGVFARVGMSRALSIQTEAMITTKGGAVALGSGLGQGAGLPLPRTGLYDSVNPIAANLRIQTLEVPLLLRINLDQTQALSPTLSLGPSLGFELSRTGDLQQSNLPASSLVTSGGTDVGVVFGIGVEKPHGTSRFTFDARTTIGLTNLETNTYQAHGARNISLVTMLGYGFSLGGP